MQKSLVAARNWLKDDPDNETRARLTQLLGDAESGSSEAIAELKSAFAGPLEFGTAGLRGPLGPGPARMNRAVVTRAAAGFAAWLTQRGAAGGKVIIGYDARYNSDVFARDTAEVFAAAGFKPLLVSEPTPTPVIAFGIQHYGCVAGIVVTASHNPPLDNGYKVYLGDGSQIVPPTDTEIAAEIARVSESPVSEIPRSTSYETGYDELIQAYIDQAKTLVADDAPREIKWVYTAMHGVGGKVVDQTVDATGFPAGIPVAAQQQPDPAFPTVSFPNPEEPGAIDLALALAKEHDADLVIANDPDADRCAVAAPVGGNWRMLTGDELGALLGDDAMRRNTAGTYACSVVSATLLGRMAEARGLPFTTTLTGFKWIGRVPDLAFGYEEAIGYCCDSHAVPDKDGITALIRILTLAAGLRAEGRTVSDRLDEIAREYGVHATSQLSVRVQELSIIADAMAKLRGNPPSELVGEPVTVRDLANPGPDWHLPPTDGVELTGPTVHVVARPSGTEPKLKCYLEVRGTAAEAQKNLEDARSQAAAKLDSLRSEMASALGL